MPNDDTKKKPLFDLTKLQIADDFDDGLRGQKVYDIIRCDKPQPNEWFKLFDLGEGFKSFVNVIITTQPDARGENQKYILAHERSLLFGL